MRKLLTLSLVALTAGCMAEPPVEMSAEAQSRLTEELAGRTAGPPQACVQSRDLKGNRSVGEDAIIFSTNNRNLVYVNRPPAGCPSMRMGDAMRTQSITSRLCSGEIIEVFDPVGGFTRGSCSLGQFTPYRLSR